MCYWSASSRDLPPRAPISLPSDWRSSHQFRNQLSAPSINSPWRRHMPRTTLQACSAHGSLWPTLLIGIGLTVLATPLLQLFGDDFPTARAALIALAISNVTAVFMGPAQEVLIMTGRQSRIPRIMIICAVVHLAALCLLVPPLGALGAALSSVVSGLIGTVWLMIVTQREAGIGTTVLGRLGK
jgi:Polysaccharide biosynthesis C-terminal domain